MPDSNNDGKRTGNGHMAAFSEADMQRRWTRARQLMAERGLDALLVTNEENFQYFTGTTGTLGLHYSLARPAVVVFPLEGEPVAIVGELISQSVQLTSYVREVRGYTDVMAFPYRLVIDAIKDLGDGVKRIGSELGLEQRMGIPVGDYLAIVQSMPGVQFEDGAGVLVPLRMVKTPGRGGLHEASSRRHRPGPPALVRRGRAGHDRTGRGSPVAPADTRGRRRSDLFRSSHRELSRLPLPASSCISTPAPTCATTPSTTQESRPSGLRATRPSAATRSCLKANARMIDALKPGVTCAELHHIAAEIVTKAGYDIIPAGRMGHGQGILFTEPPSICPDDHTVLEEGMVISTEPEVTLSMLWEDVHVITADGHDQLTQETVELREIPFG